MLVPAAQSHKESLTTKPQLLPYCDGSSDRLKIETNIGARKRCGGSWSLREGSRKDFGRFDALARELTECLLENARVAFLNQAAHGLIL